MRKLEDFIEICPFNLETSTGQTQFFWTTFGQEFNDDGTYRVVINEIRMCTTIYKGEEQIFNNYTPSTKQDTIDTAILLYNELDSEPKMVTEMLDEYKCVT